MKFIDYMKLLNYTKFIDYIKFPDYMRFIDYITLAVIWVYSWYNRLYEIYRLYV